MNLKIKMRTPLWTGGIDGTMDRVHETGIIGSLRWWYEAIVRGLGGYACEGPGGQKCELTSERLQKFEKSRQNGMDWWAALDQAQTRQDREKNRPGICDACKVFGTTGWRRRFRVRILQVWEANDRDPNTTLNVRPYGRRRGWYLPAGWMGELSLALSGEPVVVERLMALLFFLEKWGNLGAKSQLGYGSFRLVNWEGEVIPLGELREPSKRNKSTLPDLRAMTFFQVRFVPRSQSWWENVDGLRQVRGHNEKKMLQNWTQEGIVPVSPTIKDAWRYKRSWLSPPLKPWLFGTLQKNFRLRSKVNIGWAIRQPDHSWLIRGWVWLPRSGPARSKYASLVDGMRRLIEDESGWLEALHLRGEAHGIQVRVFPSGSPWGIKKASLVRGWLDSILEEV